MWHFSNEIISLIIMEASLGPLLYYQQVIEDKVLRDEVDNYIKLRLLHPVFRFSHLSLMSLVRKYLARVFVDK